MRIIGLDIHRAFAEAVAWHDGKLRRPGRVDMRDSIPRSVISVHNSSKASTPGRRSNQRHDPCPAQGGLWCMDTLTPSREVIVLEAR